jgi:hypothetical protein
MNAAGRPTGGVVRKVFCQDTDPRARSSNQAATRRPRAIHLNGLNHPHQCVPTSPDDPAILIPQVQRSSKIANRYTSCTLGAHFVVTN